MSALAVYLACFTDPRPHLAPGELATTGLIAADRALEGVPGTARLLQTLAVAGGHGERGMRHGRAPAG